HLRDVGRQLLGLGSTLPLHPEPRLLEPQLGHSRHPTHDNRRHWNREGEYRNHQGNDAFIHGSSGLKEPFPAQGKDTPGRPRVQDPEVSWRYTARRARFRHPHTGTSEMRVSALAAALLAVSTVDLTAQSEAMLRRTFEGSTVIVKIDMPGTSSGVHVYPLRSRPVDFPDGADKLKKYGTSIRTGDAVMVTKVKVKDDLIEFQLGGGGYGTFGDDMGSSTSATVVQKTSAEKALEDSIKKSTSS